MLKRVYFRVGVCHRGLRKFKIFLHFSFHNLKFLSRELCGDSQGLGHKFAQSTTRSTTRGSGPRDLGLRGFKSPSPHHFFFHFVLSPQFRRKLKRNSNTTGFSFQEVSRSPNVFMKILFPSLFAIGGTTLRTLTNLIAPDGQLYEHTPHPRHRP
jgi:hypothetical protein